MGVTGFNVRRKTENLAKFYTFQQELRELLWSTSGAAQKQYATTCPSCLTWHSSTDTKSNASQLLKLAVFVGGRLDVQAGSVVKCCTEK